MNEEEEEEESSSCLDLGAITVIVVGAGPAGLATSLALSNVCKEVVLLEKHQEFLVRGSTFGIWPNGAKALEEISPSIWEDMLNGGIPLGSGGVFMPWWEMRNILLQHVRNTENIRLETGREFKGIVDRGEQGVDVLLSDATNDLVHGDFLVGADGIGSAVRTWLELPPALPTKTTNYRGAFLVNETSSAKLKSYVNGESVMPFFISEYSGYYFMLFNFNQRYPGRLAWVFTTSEDVDVEGEPHPLSLVESVVNEEQLSILKDVFDSSELAHLKPFPTAKVVDFSDELLEKYDGRWGGKGRVTITGDAAHGMRPTDGQGGNMAFEDAVMLVRSLKSATDISEALAEFERTRLPRVKKIHDNQRLRYEERVQTSKSPPMDDEMKAFIVQGV